MTATKRIAIFASGAGSNAKKIITYFTKHPQIHVSLVVCNKPGAGVINIAKEYHISVLMIEKEEFLNGTSYLSQFREASIDFIVLAGFLWKVPQRLIDSYRNKIVNIHPALLPKYGGKGMYGEKVHEAVLAAGEKESGITIHYLDEHFDNGDQVLQVKCPVLKGDTPATLAERIHALEHKHYSQVIEKLVLNVE
jgi:phosphoribosylglycinamide formyltransferase-1